MDSALEIVRYTCEIPDQNIADYLIKIIETTTPATEGQTFILIKKYAEQGALSQVIFDTLIMNSGNFLKLFDQCIYEVLPEHVDEYHIMALLQVAEPIFLSNVGNIKCPSPAFILFLLDFPKHTPGFEQYALHYLFLILNDEKVEIPWNEFMQVLNSDSGHCKTFLSFIRENSPESKFILSRLKFILPVEKEELIFYPFFRGNTFAPLLAVLPHLSEIDQRRIIEFELTQDNGEFELYNYALDHGMPELVNFSKCRKYCNDILRQHPIAAQALAILQKGKIN